MTRVLSRRNPFKYRTARTILGQTDGYQVERGEPHPPGATVDADGVNFSLYADRATAVTLLIFDAHDAPNPVQVIQLDPIRNKTFRFWHVYLRGAKPGISYAYRVDGAHDLHGAGDRYNANKVVIDPYSRGNTNTLWSRAAATTPDDNVTTSMRSIVVDTSNYDWEGDKPLNHPLNESVIYEMHVRGFTRSPDSGCRYPGTFAGVIEKIPYLKQLGVTAVELLPVFDFDETEVKQIGPDGKPLPNFWGYDPFSYFCPQSLYCVSPTAGKHLTEFRDMVKALHKADIEVILDVVFNHTSEGNENGPVINFKGLANSTYYLLSEQDKQYYMNYSGCGNTVNANHPITEKLIIDALHFWVREMHVDGFRFDEAVILTRDSRGEPMIYPPVIWQIELSDTLADTKIIAEVWDAAGLNQFGYFPGYRWGEWNGRYRDTIRRFVRGDQGYIDGKTIVGRVADVISGSADIFQANQQLPVNSINFITAHDGFTMNDLVSYSTKHNEANGEGNRDGSNENCSANYGVEGPTSDPQIEQLRLRQIKNFCAILLLSQGVPMFVAGDEVRRTQLGNNNAYCQDNEISWFNWQLVESNQGLLRFFQQMIAFRKAHPILRRMHFFDGEVNRRGLHDVTWHGCKLNEPGWFDPNARVLAFTLGGIADEEDEQESDDVDMHIIFNMDVQDLDFELPVVDGRHWYRVVDTGLNAPEDFAEPGHETPVTTATYHAMNRSVVVLMNR